MFDSPRGRAQEDARWLGGDGGLVIFTGLASPGRLFVHRAIFLD